jgi:hypothetical protein
MSEGWTALVRTPTSPIVGGRGRPPCAAPSLEIFGFVEMDPPGLGADQLQPERRATHQIAVLSRHLQGPKALICWLWTGLSSIRRPDFIAIGAKSALGGRTACFRPVAQKVNDASDRTISAFRAILALSSFI